MEMTRDDLDKAEQGLLQLQEQERQITRMVARQEGIVLYLRQRLEEGQNGDGAMQPSENIPEPAVIDAQPMD